MAGGPLAARAWTSCWTCCWLIATALSLHEITIVQLGGAPATAGQLMVDCGFGNKAFSEAAQRARSNAASFTTPVGPAPAQVAAAFAVPTQVWMESGVFGPNGRALLAAACSTASL